MEKLKMGLVGCGGMMKSHVSAVPLLKDIDIVAVCDVVRANAEEVASVLNDPVIVSDYHDMVDLVDCVLVALPHDLHYECGMFFAKKGKHLLMEKPLCNTEEECLSLIETCEQMGVMLMCAYPVRFWEGVVKMKEEIDSGKYGQLMQMSIWTEQLTGADWSSLPTPPWGATARLGGGQFFSHGCHYVDILIWFLGNPVKGTHFGTRNGTPWMLKEGTSIASFTFENGALGYHGATWGARGSRLGTTFQIHTEKGMLEYVHKEGEVRLYNAKVAHVPGQIEHSSDYKVLWRREGERSKQTQFEIAHFAECVRTGKQPLTHGRAALQSLRVIWKMYEAEKNNTIADLTGLGLENA